MASPLLNGNAIEKIFFLATSLWLQALIECPIGAMVCNPIFRGGKMSVERALRFGSFPWIYGVHLVSSVNLNLRTVVKRD